MLDGTAKTVRVNTYVLEDGKWELVTGGGGMSLKAGEKKGRMAFGFEDLRGEYREAVQFGKDFTAVKYGSCKSASPSLQPGFPPDNQSELKFFLPTFSYKKK